LDGEKTKKKLCYLKCFIVLGNKGSCNSRKSPPKCNALLTMYVKNDTGYNICSATFSLQDTSTYQIARKIRRCNCGRLPVRIYFRSNLCPYQSRWHRVLSNKLYYLEYKHKFA